MSRVRFFVAMACTLGVIGSAPARSQPVGGLAPSQIIAARQASLELSAVTFASMLHAADGGADAKSQTFQSAALSAWAKALPTLFPAGTGPGGPAQTAARPEIWTDRAGFAQKAGAYSEEAAKLADLAKAGDSAGFKAQLPVVRAACGACHDAYRAKS